MSDVLTNNEIANKLRLLADLLEIGGEAAVKLIAYRRAADNIDALPEGLAAIRSRHALLDIPGVGKGIAEKIENLLDTGTMNALEKAQAVIPVGVAELLAVPDVGPKRARQLFEQGGIASLAQLREASASGELAKMAFLGPKGAQRITVALSTMGEPDTRIPLPLAIRLGNELIAALRERCPEITEIELTGSIRRFRETTGDIDMVAAAEHPKVVVDAFSQLPGVARIEMHGEDRCRIALQTGLSADLRVMHPRHWGSLLQHFTGSKYHNVKLREMTIDRGWSMSEYGYKRGDELVTCATEAEVYAFLEMDWIPPTLREESGEIELAVKHDLPKIVGFDGLKGDLHMHSTWSDGANTIEEMARAAIARGYEYICFTDHSRGLGIANGLTPERLVEQRKEIDHVNTLVAPFRVLHGVEVEVMNDGSLDLPDEVLALLDLTIASVHSGTRRGKEATTRRAIAAVEHPLVDILAHPTGRVLGSRGPGDFDIPAILEAAAKAGTAVEINGSRIDLSDVNAKAALAAGCTIEIGSDAHAVEGLEEIIYAIGTAQRAWVTPDRVLNAQPLDKMLASLKRNRNR
jgi:DNA polymerase (family 10)